jgi:hypothetical protein
MEWLRRWSHDVIEVITAPRLKIDLMFAETKGNHPFFENHIREVYREMRQPHPKLPLVPRFKYGVAAQRLPETHDAYLARISRTARQNIAKAKRLGYRVGLIDYNAWLDDVMQINGSALVRQGAMPSKLVAERPPPIADPPSSTDVHDHVFYGVTRADTLVAYGACLYAGEAMILTIIFGHAAHQNDGIVPLLFSGMVADAIARFPRARYFIYDTYFGGRESFRRFKRKMGFTPHTVTWRL